jgi:hypothetical protein
MFANIDEQRDSYIDALMPKNADQKALLFGANARYNSNPTVDDRTATAEIFDNSLQDLRNTFEDTNGLPVFEKTTSEFGGLIKLPKQTSSFAEQIQRSQPNPIGPQRPAPIDDRLMDFNLF